MLNQFSRTELLYGKEAMERLANARVAIFGLGGVGGYTAEALARSGVGTFDLIDDDKVCLTNLNRQIIATRKTVGKYKTDVMKERMLEINPNVDVHIHKCFFLPENADELPKNKRWNGSEWEHYEEEQEELPKRPIEDMSISCRTNCICPPGAAHKCTERRDIPGSVAYVPSVAGLIIAGEVVKDLTTVKK